MIVAWILTARGYRFFAGRRVDRGKPEPTHRNVRQTYEVEKYYREIVYAA